MTLRGRDDTQELLDSAWKSMSDYPPLSLPEMRLFVAMAEEELRNPQSNLPRATAIIILRLALTPPPLEVLKELRGDARLPGF